MVCLTQGGYWTCLEHIVRLEICRRVEKAVPRALVTRADMRRQVEVAGWKGQEVITTDPWIAAAPDARGGGKVGQLPKEG